MDGPNLMEFISPKSQEKTNCTGINRSRSPGNNPFDSLSKDVANSCDVVSNLNISPTYTETIINFNDDVKDTKRELVGCLNEDSCKKSFELIDGPHLKEFGAFAVDETADSKVNQSSAPGNRPFDVQCKNTVNPSENVSNSHTFTQCIENVFNCNDIQSCGRESLAFMKEIDLSGRESLGILKLEMLNTSFNAAHLNAPNVTALNSPVNSEKSKDFCSSLNTAFLQPFSYLNKSDAKGSGLSSGSSVSSCMNPSFFNSASLDASELSKINSVNFGKHFDSASQSEDPLNAAFLNSFGSRLRFSSGAASPRFGTATGERGSLNVSRDRIASLPDFNKVKMEAEKRVCRSESGAAINDLNEEVDNEFNDSVFIEANHLAYKISDGSILDANETFEENLLDCTSPPSFEDMEETDADEVKVDAETVFKTIDKMLPVQDLKIEDKEDVNSYINSNIQDYNSNNDVITNQPLSPANRELKQNLSNIFNASQKGSSCSSGSSISSKLRDANELLQNLSAIINNENRDSDQNIQGQQLLFGLADILCSGSSKHSSKDKFDNLEDSGHSSIEHEEQQNEQDLHQCFEVLDLRVGSKSQDNKQVLDLSLKSKLQSVGKRLSQSFSFPAPKMPPANLFVSSNAHVMSASSASSLGKKSKTGLDPSKLKPKKIEDKNSSLKKGPLKAVIPLGNMSKRLAGKFSSGTVTPPKLEQNSAIFKITRTSTPITEQELRPVAQSTPDNLQSTGDRNRPISCSSQLKKRRFYCPVSPLARPSSIGDMSGNTSNKTSRSGSTPNLSNQSGSSRRDSLIPSPKPLHRRHSASELKATNQSTKLKRSYSIGMDRKPPNLTDKLKQNAAAALSNSTQKAGGVNSLKKPLPKKTEALQERNRGTTNIKAFNLLAKLKKGKENIVKKNNTASN